MFDTLALYWQIMTPRDAAMLFVSAALTLLVGGFIMYLGYRRLLAREEAEAARLRRTPWITKMEFNRQPSEAIAADSMTATTTTRSTGGTLPAEVGEEIAKRIAATPAHQALLAERQKQQQQQQDDPSSLEKRVDKARRNIPLGASSQLVQKGTRLIEEGAFDEALVCFLSLLYSAVENGRAQPDNLPAHLAECLRGAGTCYRKMGQIEIAARFFQAERLIYEEMVAGLSDYAKNGGKNGGGGADGKPASAAKDKSRAIVASLFKEHGAVPGDDDDDEGGEGKTALPRRCHVLQEVAAQCMKFGHKEVALSYQLKMSALKRRATKKPMEPGSDEFEQIAAVLRALGEEKAAAPATAAAAAASE